MDGRGRLAQPLKRSTRPRRAGAPRLHVRLQVPISIKRAARRYLLPIRHWRLPRGAPACAVLLLLAGSIGYGAVRGGHLPTVAAQVRDARDALANAAGFRIGELSVAGTRQLTRTDILAGAGVSARTSLLFLDVEHARDRLKTSPWIAEATVRKIYPDRLQIDVEERDAFALWQRDGKIHVVAADGTVLAPLGDARFAALPLVVGPGAERKAKGFLAVLDRYPGIREQVRASILVGERRWNLKLKNGIDVRLPETNAAGALDTLAALDRDKQLLTRDITAVDLRLADRVTVRLSDAAAQAREERIKGKKTKRKEGDA
jgi:cell division protein FtsQ